MMQAVFHVLHVVTSCTGRYCIVCKFNQFSAETNAAHWDPFIDTNSLICQDFSVASITVSLNIYDEMKQGQFHVINRTDHDPWPLWPKLPFTKANFTNAKMHLFHIPQCSIQNRNVHISVLNGALWDMEQVHSGICELGGLVSMTWAWCTYLQHNEACHSSSAANPGLEGFGQYPVFTMVFTGKYRPGKNRFWTPKVGKTGKNTTSLFKQFHI